MLGLVAGGAVGLWFGVSGAVQALFAGAVLCVGALVERTRYKPLETRAPVGPFQRTGERFIDPATHAAVTVYADPATGERMYVRDQNEQP